MKACLTKSKWSLFLLVDHPNGWASFVNFFQEDHQRFMHQWTRVNRSQQKKVGLDWPLRKNLQWLHQMILFLKAVFGFFKDSLISPLYLAVHFRISGFHRCAAHPGDFHTMEELKTQIFDLVGLEKVKESMRTRNKTSCDRIQVQENNKKSQRSLLLMEEIRRAPPVLHEHFIKHGMLHWKHPYPKQMSLYFKVLFLGIYLLLPLHHKSTGDIFFQDALGLGRVREGRAQQVSSLAVR